MPYLNGAILHWATYRVPSLKWDHDHCEFCWAKFTESGGPDSLHDGYTTDDGYRWICSQCFEDFKDQFHFSVKRG